MDETPWDSIKIYNVFQHYTKHFTLSSLEHKHFSLSGKRNDLDMKTCRYRIREFDKNFINEEKNWIVSCRRRGVREKLNLLKRTSKHQQAR